MQIQPIGLPYFKLTLLYSSFQIRMSAISACSRAIPTKDDLIHVYLNLSEYEFALFKTMIKFIHICRVDKLK